MKWTRYIGWTDNTKRKQTKTNEKALEDGLAGTLRYSRPDWSNSHLIALVVPPAAFRNVCCCFLSLSLQFKFINFTYQTTTVKSSIKNFLELFDGLYVLTLMFKYDVSRILGENRDSVVLHMDSAWSHTAVYTTKWLHSPGVQYITKEECYQIHQNCLQWIISPIGTWNSSCKLESIEPCEDW